MNGRSDNEIRDGDGYFLGYRQRNCGEHRTVGTHRAWCYDCTEWCYPGDQSDACNGCAAVALLARATAAEARVARVRELCEQALDEHEPCDPVITGIPPTCPSCRVYDPCATKTFLLAALDERKTT